MRNLFFAGLRNPRCQTTPSSITSERCSSLQELIKKECEKWANKGINIKYETRPDRKGYKAGNLAAGLKHDYVRDCKFVAIFDADFEPRQDFLEVTIPYLVYNPELAFVMGAWGYGVYGGLRHDGCLIN